MQLKIEGRTYPNVIEPILNPVETTLPTDKRTTKWGKSEIHADNEATGIMQPTPFLHDDEDLLIFPALWTTQNNKHIVQIDSFWTTHIQSRKQRRMRSCRSCFLNAETILDQSNLPQCGTF